MFIKLHCHIFERGYSVELYIQPNVCFPEVVNGPAILVRPSEVPMVLQFLASFARPLRLSLTSLWAGHWTCIPVLPTWSCLTSRVLAEGGVGREMYRQCPAMGGARVLPLLAPASPPIHRGLCSQPPPPILCNMSVLWKAVANTGFVYGGGGGSRQTRRSSVCPFHDSLFCMLWFDLLIHALLSSEAQLAFPWAWHGAPLKAYSCSLFAMNNAVEAFVDLLEPIICPLEIPKEGPWSLVPSPWVRHW